MADSSLDLFGARASVLWSNDRGGDLDCCWRCHCRSGGLYCAFDERRSRPPRRRVPARTSGTETSSSALGRLHRHGNRR